jgi:dihydroorotate dehydrogenase
MFNAVFDLARPMLLAFEPEQAHEISLKSMEAGLHPSRAQDGDPRLAVEAFGLRFPNPLGVAAGFDKDARVPDAILNIGCGFAEIGTVTPLPQPGNPKPRVFRLINDRAVINRLGFNNGGHAAALARLQRRRPRGIVAVNIGANKDSADRAADYVRGIETFNAVASYFTVNISSPNTPGLRDLQAPAALDDLLDRVLEVRARLVASGGPRRPIVVKIAPDITEADLDPIVDRLIAHAVDGIAVSNTTLARTGIKDAVAAKETGGLSGRPLFHRSTVTLARVYQRTGGKIPLIGIGGIDSGETALAKIEAGATLLQLYTGLIYEGPSLIGRILSALGTACQNANAQRINALTGRAAAAWAKKPLEV